MNINPKKNTVVCGDNIEWLNSISDDSVDLCYIDPPFFTNRNYEVIWGNGYEVRSFGDRFSGGISHYIEWMTPRLKLIHKKLKQTGSIFLHCDSNASHRLRVLLDDIFLPNNFKNMIVWKRCDTHNDTLNQFSMVTDHILFYSKSTKFVFSPQYTEHAEKTLKQWYKYLELPDGTTRPMTKEELDEQLIPEGARRFNTGNLTSPNPRPNLTYTYKGYQPHKNGWRVNIQTMKELDKKGLLLFPKKVTGRIMKKDYLDEQPGPVVGDFWNDIDFIRGNDYEYCGYKTQKPEALLHRILKCASKKGDTILDCFGGGGTTAKVAADLERHFIVGDVSPVAVKIIAERLNIECPSIAYEIKKLPQTIKEFKDIDGHKFAEIVCDLMGWRISTRKSNDGGIDGWDGNDHPVQIKNHSNSSAGRPDMQKFYSAIVKSKKKKGIFVAWDFAKNAKEFVAEMKQEHGIEIIIMYCSDVFGHLIIPHEEHEKIMKFFGERYPEKWNPPLLKQNF